MKRDIQEITAGTHIATLYNFLFIGTIPDSYEGIARDTAKIRLTWELPNELHVFKQENGPQPRVISEEYTLSFGEKSNLRKIVEGMMGKMSDHDAEHFDVESLVGKSCLLNIIHKTNAKGNTYARIASTSPLMKGMEKPAQVNPSRIQTYQNWDQEYFDKLPNFIKEKVMSSQEYQSMMNQGESDPNETVKVGGLGGYPKEILKDPFADSPF